MRRGPMRKSRHRLAQRLQCAVTPPTKLDLQSRNVFVVQTGTQEAGERPLAQDARAVIHLHLHVGEALHDRLVRHDPTDAQSRRQRLRRTAERNHHAGLVKRLQRQWRFTVEYQVAVGTVLDDRQTVGHATCDQFMPPPLAHGDACRIMIGRNRVQNGVLRMLPRCGRRQMVGWQAG